MALASLGLIAVGATGAAVAISAMSEPPAPKYVSLARQVNPIGGKGRALNMSRVVIQPGAKIPLHMHQGTQISWIKSGVLTYTVEAGKARVMRGPGDSGRKVRVIKAGQTGRIKAGQWVVEQPSNHHHAANKGKKPVVIFLANLLLKNAKPSKLLP